MTVNLDRKLGYLEHHAQIAGLKRLSARAAAAASSRSPRDALGGAASLEPLAAMAMEKLKDCKVEVEKGLTEEEMLCIEARMAVSFPPDLAAVLRRGLPVGAGFPDWRSASEKQLRVLLNLPIAGLLYQVARGNFWYKPWGSRPSDASAAVHIARSALLRHPILIPLFRHCYIPASPNLASNPIFFVSHHDVHYCARDIAHFFQTFCAAPDSSASASFRSDHLCSSSPSLLFSSSSSPSFSSFRCPPPSHSGGFIRTTPHRLRNDRDFLEDICCGADSDGSETTVGRRGFHGWQNLSSRGDNNNSCNNSNSCSSSSSKPSGSSDESMDLTSVAERHNSSNDRLAFTLYRRIEFWSDLAEKKYMGSADDDHVMTGNKEAEAAPDSSGGVSGESAKKTVANNLIPCWLERYFDKMATVLRNEGWKETDLADMLLVLSPSLSPAMQPLPPAAELMGSGGENAVVLPEIAAESLVLYVDLLSDILRRAGWSTSEVAEAFDVDLCVEGGGGSRRRRRPAVALPSHIAAKVGKLAEMAAAHL